MKTPLEFYMEEMPNTPVVPNVSSMKIETFSYLMREYAELYHTEQRKKECHCGGYPECICNLEEDDLKDVNPYEVGAAKKIMMTPGEYYKINPKHNC